ncbi:MAG TPA: 2'-5' RNA ligase family protein [Chryseolinea sp.]
MKKFAVDIVILPPDGVMDTAIALNKRHCNTNIVLDKDNCLPHVSLVMGCITSEGLERAPLILKTIGSQFKVMELTATAIRTVGTAAGDVIAIDIKPNRELQELHESVVNAFSPLLSGEAVEADLMGGADVNPLTLKWINSFIKQSSFDNFWPHITVGYLRTGANPETIESFSFNASRLAIGHLGNFCTCREILIEASLTA